MDHTSSRPGRRMTRMRFAARKGRRSLTAALGALFVVAALAGVAVTVIGSGSALAHRGLGASAIAVRPWDDPPGEPVPMPQVPADAQAAQPMSTF